MAAALAGAAEDVARGVANAGVERGLQERVGVGARAAASPRPSGRRAAASTRCRPASPSRAPPASPRGGRRRRRGRVAGDAIRPPVASRCASAACATTLVVTSAFQRAEHHLLEQRRGGDDVADPQPRKEHLRERADVDHLAGAIEGLQRRDRRAFVAQLAVVVVLEDRHLVLVGEREQRPPARVAHDRRRSGSAPRASCRRASRAAPAARAPARRCRGPPRRRRPLMTFAWQAVKATRAPK